ncbi:hypothetical protein C2I27_04130 [Priestia megaterium]|uniref:hypothetical protein n=1 Tax=Priestia megaterium TaxID=1404 RepID=UPI000D5148C2|nr:hypothetical protein [Priestia megaterium]PVC75081.1 hypothetical protein C2I27_04130 [Priestia megaterium]
MDIIALGKATKVLKRAKELDEKIIAHEAESHFQTVDARLDWLEGQASKILVEGSKQLDLSQGTFDNTELVNRKIQLKMTNAISYIRETSFKNQLSPNLANYVVYNGRYAGYMDYRNGAGYKLSVYNEETNTTKTQISSGQISQGMSMHGPYIAYTDSSVSNRLCLYNVETEVKLENITSVAVNSLSIYGDYIAYVVNNGKLYLYHIPTNTHELLVEGSILGGNKLSMYKNKIAFVKNEAGGLTVFDIYTKKETERLSSGTGNQIDYVSMHEDIIAFQDASFSQKLSIYDLSTQTLRNQLSPNGAAYISVSDGVVVYHNSSTGNLTFYDTKTELTKAESYYSAYMTEKSFVGTKVAFYSTGLSILDRGGIEYQNEYSSKGTYESPVIDLGEFWHETTLMDIKKQLPSADTHLDIYIASSSDGKTFSSYQVFDPNQLPQNQFIKFKFELSATPIPGEVNTYSFNQSDDNKVTLNEFVTTNGSLQLTQDYSYVTEDVGEVEDGKVIKATIPRHLFTKMKSVEVK